MGDKMKRSNIRQIRVSEVGEWENGAEAIIQEIMAKNFQIW